MTQGIKPSAPVSEKAGALVPVVASPPQILSEREEIDRAAIVEVEKRDEDMIMRELEGHLSEEFFYEINVRGKQVRKLTYVGVKDVARRMGSITISQPIINETEDGKYYRVIVKVRDEQNRLEMWAAVEQSKFLRHSDGREERDEFALAKLLSKAQRNALRMVIPEAAINQALKAWTGEKPATAPPTSTNGQRSSAIAMVREYAAKNSEQRQEVWTMLETKGIAIDTFPGWNELPDEILAFLVAEVNALIENDKRLV